MLSLLHIQGCSSVWMLLCYYNILRISRSHPVSGVVCVPPPFPQLSSCPGLQWTSGSRHSNNKCFHSSSINLTFSFYLQPPVPSSNRHINCSPGESFNAQPGVIETPTLSLRPLNLSAALKIFFFSFSAAAPRVKEEEGMNSCRGGWWMKRETPISPQQVSTERRGDLSEAWSWPEAAAAGWEVRQCCLQIKIQICSLEFIDCTCACARSDFRAFVSWL